MELFTKEIFFIIFVSIFFTWWSLTEKYKPIRKYIILLGSLTIVIPAGYMAGKTLDIPELAVLVVFALISAPLVYIRMFLLRRKLKKLDEQSDDHN